MKRTRMLRLSIAAGTLLIGTVAGAAPAMATGAVPYTDPSSSGFLGLCNQAGQQVTSGSVGAVPFAWLAASSVPAKAPYNGSGRSATLFAFLPLQGFPPGDWSGETMTAASSYSNPTVPMAAATSKDPSLGDFIEAYPPKWDGFIQLRMYLDTTNQPAATKHYPTLDIQVTGETWHAVGGGPVNCGAGTATSAEAVLTPTTTAPPTTSVSSNVPATGSPVGSSSSGGSSAGAQGASSSTGNSSTTVPSSSTPAHASGAQGGSGGGSGNGAAGQSPSGSSAGLVIGLVLGALVLLGALAYTVVRLRRSRARSASAADPEVKNGDESDKVEQFTQKGL